MNGEEVTIDSKFIPHRPKDMVGCFIVQVLENVNKEVEVRNLSVEYSIELHEDYVYDSLCIWDEEIDNGGNYEDCIEEICLVAALSEVKAEFHKVVKERVGNGASLEFDDENCTIMESIANMVEECCIFEGVVFLEAKDS